MEINPLLGNESDQARTLATAVEVMAAAFGKRRRGQTPTGYQLPRPTVSVADLQ